MNPHLRTYLCCGVRSKPGNFFFSNRLCDATGSPPHCLQIRSHRRPARRATRARANCAPEHACDPPRRPREPRPQ